MSLILDQQQTDHSWGITSPISYYTPDARAQTFIAGLSGSLERVDLWIKKSPNSNNLVVEIRTISGNLPTSTILASQTVPYAQLPSDAELEVTFSSPAIISSGVGYAVVVHNEGYNYGVNENFWMYGDAISDLYANGQWSYSIDSGVTWNPLSGGTADAYFQTYVEIIPEILKDLTNDFRMAGTVSIANIINDFRLSGATLSNIVNDFRMVGQFILKDIINDFRSRLTSLSNIINKFNMVKEVVKNISNKFNLVLEPIRFMTDIINKFNLAEAKIYDFLNDIRTHKKEIGNISNDFRTITSWQVPGDAGIPALGKSAFTLKINNVDKTSILDLDSLRWQETLNSSATASFNLAVPYDSGSCPSENQSVEILFDSRRKFYGYITNISKLSNPEGITITAEDEYWNLNKSNVDFKVGRKIEGDESTYYNTISEALSTCGFSIGIGGFIPEVFSCVGSKADVISQLVRESGNFGWFIKPNGTKKLWQAAKGDILNLEKQEIGKNIGLYQVIDHNILEDSSGIINRLKVIMGEDVLVSFNNEFRFAYIGQEYTQYSSDYMGYYRKDDDGEVIPFPEYQREHYSTIAWYDRRKDTDQQAYEAYISGGWKITVPPGMTPGYPLGYKLGTIWVVDPRTGKREIKEVSAWGTITEKDLLAENTNVRYSWRRRYDWGGIYPEGRRERVFYITMGSYPQTITKDLVLSSLNVQYGANYKEWEGHTWSKSEETTAGYDPEFPVTINYTGGHIHEKSFQIPSWDDEAYARDYANWQLSKTCDIKQRGTIRITMDCADFYALDLSKRIKISGIISSPVNIISIDYDVGSYMVTINVESKREYKRTISIPIHE